MKNYTLFLILFSTMLFGSHSAIAQMVDGLWHGYLRPPGASIVLTLDLQDGDDITGLMRINNSEQGMAFSSCEKDGDRLILRISDLNIELNLKLVDEMMTGTFAQEGQSLDISFGREALEEEVVRRSQDPIAPFPYRTEEVEIALEDHILAGTMFMPEGEVKTLAIFITGSGPQNRDEEILGHKPFLVIADDLAHAGIATLRCDDRGVGESTGDFSSATSADFASDVSAIVDFARRQTPLSAAKVGLIGHSEGGIVAAMVASQGGIDFVISLAGPGVIGSQLLTTQQRDIMMSQGYTYDDAVAYSDRITSITNIIISAPDGADLDAMIDGAYDALRKDGSFSEELISAEKKQLITSLKGPWMRYFMNLDPAPYWEKVSCPTLAMNGDKDLQVAHGANLRSIGFAMRRGGNKQFTSKTLMNHNHLFQETSTGSLSEYGELDQTISPEALRTIREWLLALK
ncbi:MAG: alpha/beta fold hydrolase [Cryomorphaceae bacterium]|nr:alpha/beta fold hydrolase [Cryomorphaceae bacterium]